MSGIMKMMAIGLGNQQERRLVMNRIPILGKNIELFGKAVLKHAAILSRRGHGECV